MILPDEVFTVLAHMLHKGEKLQWDVGDYIEELWNEVFQALNPDESQRVAHADLIRTLAEGTGADKTTLNDRQNMANFFPVAAREKYHMLTYSQLRACKRAGDDWETWADWSLVNGYNGKPAGVHTIRRAIARADDPNPYWVGQLKKLEELVLKIHNDEEIPWQVFNGTENILLILETVKAEVDNG